MYGWVPKPSTRPSRPRRLEVQRAPSRDSLGGDLPPGVIRGTVMRALGSRRARAPMAGEGTCLASVNEGAAGRRHRSTTRIASGWAFADPPTAGFVQEAGRVPGPDWPAVPGCRAQSARGRRLVVFCHAVRGRVPSRDLDRPKHHRFTRPLDAGPRGRGNRPIRSHGCEGVLGGGGPWPGKRLLHEAPPGG